MTLDDKWDCLNSGGDWVKLLPNFDNIFSSLNEIFMISQTFSWSITMYTATTLRGIDLVPQ
jgi:hypothetical protein